MIKKLTLSALLMVGAFAMHAQTVILNVMNPSTIAGLYDHTNQGDGSGWGLANLLNPADAVLGHPRHDGRRRHEHEQQLRVQFPE